MAVYLTTALNYGAIKDVKTYISRWLRGGTGIHWL